MGNQFVHMELSTGDVSAAKKFYKRVFDWKLNELGAEMGNYTLINTGSKTVGGGIAGKMMPEQPTAWLVYAEVASVKKTIAKAEKAGAKTMVAFQEIGDMGAIGIFVDPTGAAFGVWERTKKKAPKKKAAKAAKKSAGKKAGKKKK
jgi:predicted enzyme related to lactoylglutathione lyase